MKLDLRESDVNYAVDMRNDAVVVSKINIECLKDIPAIYEYHNLPCFDIVSCGWL